ncbi:MAG: 2-C-methyl-D-erythritol 4-phosphate cytidylyltransferase [Candidatus Korarchaeota archaeon]
MKKTLAIILAGGRGERFRDEIPKQFVNLAGKPIICHAIEKFEKHPLIDEIYVVIPEEFYHYTLELVRARSYKKVTKILIGGRTRQESSRVGVFAAPDDVENILIHDAVRPFVSEEIINNVIKALEKFDAVDTAIPVTDTIIEAKEKIIVNIPKRDYLYRGQTPQGFKSKIIKKAHELALRDGINNAPDDCSLVLRYRLAEIYVVEGSEFNIKITYPLDLHLADKILQLNYVKVSGKLEPSINEQIRGKVLIVFGGTSGIGEKIHNLWNQLNGKSYAFSRRTGVDITHLESVAKALEQVYSKEGKIDAIVVTAGILKPGFLHGMDLKDIINTISTNLFGPIIVSKLSIQYLKETKGSLLLFGSSSYSYGRAGYVPYSASKAALVNLVQGLADELGPYGIRVNIINPERTDTPMRRAAFGNEDKNTLLSPEYVAKVAINVLLKDITGAVIDVRKVDEIREKHNKQGVEG